MTDLVDFPQGQHDGCLVTKVLNTEEDLGCMAVGYEIGTGFVMGTNKDDGYTVTEDVTIIQFNLTQDNHVQVVLPAFMANMLMGDIYEWMTRLHETDDANRCGCGEHDG